MTKDREWRDSVVSRDGGVCAMRRECWGESREEYLIAHHIRTKKARPDLRHVVSNGITVCHKCHVWVHKHPEAAMAIIETKEL